MPRHGDSTVYDVANRFSALALAVDGSLFTPSVPIWSLQYLDELNERYVENPEFGDASFEDKLKGQLAGASAGAHQLMVEALYVYYLPARFNITGDTKRNKLQDVISWSPQPIVIPDDLLAALDEGVGSGGPGFHLYKWASLSFLLTFARRWKQASTGIREEALTDAWRFRDFVGQVPTDGGGIYGRESLLHILFPDYFERIFSGSDKARLAGELKLLVDDPKANVDRRIYQIRSRLTTRFGEAFDFYDTDGVRALWKRFDNPLREFVFWCGRFRDRARFGPDERDYKLEIVTRISKAKDALLADGDWLPLLKRAFTTRNNLTPWQAHDAFLKWCEDDPGDAVKALRRLWEPGGEPLLRLGEFFSLFPRSVVSGLGVRTTLGSFLLFGLDPYMYPPYRVTAMHAAYRLAHHEVGDEKHELAMYREALGFMDKVREQAQQSGVTLLDRLDAQSVIWCVTNYPAPEEWPEEDRVAFDRYREGSTGEDQEYDPDEDSETVDVESVVPSADPLIGLADELLLDHATLVEIASLVKPMEQMLKPKGQVIFYGPPGTGKTYVALKLAAALAGDPGRVQLVQFHPSYSYEDFVEGYRPSLVDGQAGFILAQGPLKQLADRAQADPGNDYFLIIDEMNRGNLAKIFGELYFLLEYRDQEIRLQYSDLQFRLPPNLRMIGTMNTADRSIALLDAALRRRFAFVPFFPDRPPVAGLLGRWLARYRSDMVWVADIVDLANERLADQNGAIGPSFFMRQELNEARLDFIWRHEITPYLEDYFFDSPERLTAFELAVLRAESAKSIIANSGVPESATLVASLSDPDASPPDADEEAPPGSVELQVGPDDGQGSGAPPDAA